jgi:16S rRNA (guanine(966)-N(2))-methyltransferase RsmD
MRVSGGALAGKRVGCPAGIIRPAMDKMRESVFAVLGELDGLSFLDLFSGSGIIALEAASRGAAFVEAVESDPKKRSTLIENVEGAPVRINCKFMPVELYIKRTKLKNFDIVFCDPPFIYKYKEDLLASIAKNGIIREGGLVLLHHPGEEHFELNGVPLEILEEREYGRSVVSFYVKRKNESHTRDNPS